MRRLMSHLGDIFFYLGMVVLLVTCGWLALIMVGLL